MPSTVYKGDLTEISFGHETGLQLPHNYGGSNFTFAHQSTDAAAGTSTIRLAGGASNSPVESGVLQLPRGMLVGARLTIIGGTNFPDDDGPSTGKVFTVVQHQPSATETDFVVTPALSEAVITTSGVNDALHFHSFTLPSVDVGMGYDDAAASSSESVLTDQFVGLAATVTLPETKVDLKRYHIVGLGRDVAVQVPGRFINEGGSFEVNMHNPRWLYYCLGMEAVDVGSTYDGLCVSNDYALNGATKVGASSISFDGTGAPTFSSGSSAVTVGDYVIIKDETRADVITYNEADSADGTEFGAVTNPETTYFDKTETSEIRRIVGLSGSSASGATATVTVTDGDAAHGLTAGQKITLTSHDGTIVDYFVSDTNDSGAANLTAVTNGTQLKATGSITATLSTGATRGIAVGFNLSGATTQNGFLVLLKAAIEAVGGHNGKITVGSVPVEANGNQAITLTQAQGGTAGNTAVTEDIANLTSTAFTGGTDRLIFLDDGLLFPHADDTVIRFARFTSDNTNGSPNRESTGNIQNPVKRLLYSRSTVPSFAMEVSIRRRDSDGSVDDVVDGGATDTKQLTRVFRGCKVKDFSMTADTDAALRLTVNFDSALCYTDTGRLETSKGDRYNPHRMFEDTANTDAKRKESGIAKGTQKPYMFYNGTIDLAGVRIGQVVSFNLAGSTGVQQFYTINGSPVADSETDQVPHAGSRNASIAVEGKTEYNLDMEIIVDDPVFYHHMRRAVDFNATTANMIRLSFTKAGSGATRERIDILLDDYVIIEAPLPIPEDKGPIRAPLKVMPKSIRVVSTDTLFHC